MGKFLEEPDRPAPRRGNFVAKRRVQEAEKFEEQFDQPREDPRADRGECGLQELSRLRVPREGASITRRNIVLLSMMPWRARSFRRTRIAGPTPPATRLDKLRPWDSAVDPLNRPALKPFERSRLHGDAHAEDFRSTRS